MTETTEELETTRGLIDYPLPLDPRTTARLWLPRNLTKQEADRIYAMMLTLTEENR